MKVTGIETLLLEEARSPHNPLGARGAGEGGITAGGAAIANAVRDALGLEGAVPGLPLTPDVLTNLLQRIARSS